MLTVYGRSCNPVARYVHGDVEHRRRVRGEWLDELPIQAENVQLAAMSA